MSTLLYWIPTVAYMGLIFYLSSLPGRGIPSRIPDSLLHLAEYFILMFLAIISFSRGIFRPAGKKIYVYAFLLTVLYGLSDELHQFLTAGRHPSLKDWIFDILGALLGAVFYRLCLKIRRG